MIYDLRFTNGGARLRRALICLLLPLASCLSPLARSADFQVVGYVEITNTPAGASTNIVFNIGTSDTRTWTNGVVTPSTSIQITNSTSAARTNLAAHLTSYPVYSVGVGTPELIPIYSSTNTSVIEFWAPVNTNLSISFGGNWAKVYYVTNPFNLSNPILIDTNRMSSNARTNAVNSVVNLLASGVVASNKIAPGKEFMAHYTDNTSSQTVSNKTLTSPIINGGRLVNATNVTGTNVAFTNVTLYVVAVSGATSISGIATAITNGNFYSNVLHWSRITNVFGLHGTVWQLADGVYTNGYFPNATSSNLVNRGNAISSPGAGGNSEQFGDGALANGDNVAVFGFNAYGTNTGATAVGSLTTAREQGTAVGAFTLASTNTTVVGYGSYGSGIGNTILGVNNDDNGYNDVILIGSDILADGSSQVFLGSSAMKTTVLGPLLPAGGVTNATWRGTNVLNGRLDLTSGARTSLANGYNSGTVLGTNVYIRLSGASGAATNAGFAAAVDGTFYLVQVDNPGLSYTLLNESGLEATAANRIVTSTGALMNSTNNPVLMQLLYDATASRYRVLSFR